MLPDPVQVVFFGAKAFRIARDRCAAAILSVAAAWLWAARTDAALFYHWRVAVVNSACDALRAAYLPFAVWPGRTLPAGMEIGP